MIKHIRTFRFLKRKTRSFFKTIKITVKHWFGWLGVPDIIGYRGFGNGTQMLVKGFVTEDKGLAKPENKNQRWQDLISMIKRYSSDEIPDARVLVDVQGQQQTVVSNQLGLFDATFHTAPQPMPAKTQWLAYHVHLQEQLGSNKVQQTAKSEILIPGGDAAFGVISDIDDTILVSHATQTLRKLRLMLFRNSRTRKPFPGAAAFYRALHKGATEKQQNPFFYVSSSEWNLYDLLDDFCTFNLFPKGVFLLREMQVSIFKFWKSGGGNHDHKKQKITAVFEMYPELQFVLIGDNGQHDPEIYSEIARRFPKQIKAVYIRVVRKKNREQRLQEIAADMKKLGIDMIFARDTTEVAHHAIEEKLISKNAINNIVVDAQPNN